MSNIHIKNVLGYIGERADELLAEDEKDLELHREEIEAIAKKIAELYSTLNP